MAEIERDLFGELLDPRRGAMGRPRHFVTPERRAQVRALRTEGLTQPAIAEALGITGPTLRLHYAVELGSRSQVWRRHAVGFQEGEGNE